MITRFSLLITHETHILPSYNHDNDDSKQIYLRSTPRVLCRVIEILKAAGVEFSLSEKEVSAWRSLLKQIYGVSSNNFFFASATSDNDNS